MNECIADVDISKLGHGCGQLQRTNLTGCHDVTDAGISSLGHKCGQLQSVNIARCDKVTDAGISDTCYTWQDIEL